MEKYDFILLILDVFNMTVERLDPNKVYTKNNIVLSCFAINSFKGFMNETEFKEYLEIVIPKLIEYKNR